MTTTKRPAPQDILAVTVPFALVLGVVAGLVAYAIAPAPYDTAVGIVVGLAAALASGIDATRRNLTREASQAPEEPEG